MARSFTVRFCFTAIYKYRISDVALNVNLLYYYYSNRVNLHRANNKYNFQIVSTYFASPLNLTPILHFNFLYFVCIYLQYVRTVSPKTQNVLISKFGSCDLWSMKKLYLLLEFLSGLFRSKNFQCFVSSKFKSFLNSSVYNSYYFMNGYIGRTRQIIWALTIFEWVCGFFFKVNCIELSISIVEILYFSKRQLFGQYLSNNFQSSSFELEKYF